MSCDIDSTFHISVIIPVADVLLKQAFPHCCFQIIRKQEQQEVKQPIILISIGIQIYDVWKVHHFIKEILEKEIILLAAKA